MQANGNDDPKSNSRFPRQILTDTHCGFGAGFPRGESVFAMHFDRNAFRGAPVSF